MPVCEDLATKAELQELRDQLNAVLGDKEEGGQAQVFTAGGGILATIATIATTKLGFAKANAPKAITQITMTKGVAHGFAFGLPEGKAVLEALKADGQKVPQQALNEIGEQIGKNKAVGQVGVSVASNSAASLNIVASLANIAGTLALNKATVDIFDSRINAESAATQQTLNQQNASMLRLYDKHEGELDAVNADIEQQNAAVAQQRQQIAIVQSDITNLNSQTSTLISQMTEANQTIQQLKSDNTELVSQVNGLEVELAENHQKYLAVIAQIETQLDVAITTIEKMQLDAQKQSERIALLETTVANQQTLLEEYGIDITNLQANVVDLRDDIDTLHQESEEEDQLVVIKSKIASAKFIIEQYRIEQFREKEGGNFSGITKPQVETIIDTKLRDVEQMNEQQANQINSKLDNLNSKVPSLITPTNIAVTVGGLDILRQILNKPTPLPTPCLAPALVPPVAAQARTNFAAIGTLQGITITQGGLIQKSVNAVATTTTTIQKAIQNTTYGLQAAHRLADTAWKATQADKVLSVVNTALNIHNAVMLSNNLGRSMAYIADNVLATFGIKDATTGDPINVGSLVKSKLNSMINQVLGATQADALRRQLAAYNRIYQAGANVLYSVRSIMDSTYDIAETTGENVSQIGNALKKAGAVRENAYKLMPTDFRSTSRVQRRLEKLGNAAETIEQVSSDALDITTEIKEMKANQKEFQDELAKVTEVQTKEADSKKKEATSNSEHSEEDEIRAIPKEKGD